MDEAERLRRDLLQVVDVLERKRAYWQRMVQQHGYDSALTNAAGRDLWDQVRLLSGPAETVLEQLREGDTSALPWAIAFLEADPWFFRSGYMKGKYARLLRRYELDQNQRERLRAAILNNLDKGGRLEFGEVRRLARRLDTADFRKGVSKFLDHPDPTTRERAELILASCALNDQAARDLRIERELGAR